jgi:Spirocyclase AveC-like
MALTTDAAPGAISGRRPVVPAVQKKTEPVVYWAILGGLILAFMVYVMIRWITGPYFQRVPGGPTQPSGAQHAALLVIQIGGTALAIGCLYWFLVRPWRRNGRPTTEGLLAVCYGTLYFQDPVSVAGGYWFTYNSTMWNRGSWVKYLPLFNVPTGKPGAMLAEPVFGMGSGYIYFWMLGVAVAFLVFRTAKQRLPRIGTPGAIVLAYLSALVFDVVLEAFVWMRSGFYAYPGAPGPKLFEGSFMAFPIIEGVLVGVLLVPYALLRYYKDDRGYTLVERGVDKLGLGSKGQVAVRFLALLAACHLIYFFSYNIWAYHIGTHQQTWPKAVQERSYLLNAVCGEGTDRLCPGPAVPNSRPGSSYVGRNGELTVPAGTELPPTFPLLHGRH